ncbi:MAG: hypothetical protein J7L15_04765, partial [Clostridiales bacterium]|nr:hypothetical protein [Clostridiales bacterium]
MKYIKKTKPENFILNKESINLHLRNSLGNLNVKLLKAYGYTNEQAYLAYYNTSPKICDNLNCSNDTTYVNFNCGYQNCCSNKCATKNPERQEKYKQTCLSKFGVVNRLIIVKNSSNTLQTTKQYILECKKIHKDRFIYNKTIVTNDPKIIVTCRNHGDWEVRKDAHKRGNICPKCSKIKATRKRDLTRNPKSSNLRTMKMLNHSQYCKLVDIETHKNSKSVLNIHKRSYSWHLDHKFSKI